MADGTIGDVHLVRISSRDPAPPPLEYVRGSGGIFLDMTIHDFDMARYVTGSEVVEVYACGALRVEPSFAEAGDVDTAVVTLTHANGCLTVIDNSRQAVYGYDQRVEAFGGLGMAASENPLAHTGIVRTAQGTSAPRAAALLPRSLRAQLPARVGRVRRGGPRRRDAAGHRRRRARAAGHRPGRLALVARAAPRRLDEVDGGESHGRERPVRGPAPDGKVLVVTGEHPGARRRHRAPRGERGRRGHRRLRARAPARRGGARRARGARLRGGLRRRRPRRRRRSAARSSVPATSASGASTGWSTPRGSAAAARSTTRAPSCGTGSSRSTRARRSCSCRRRRG